ncbi:MAG: protein jag [Oscillospiraceae bacterium]|nr:protein jag [Oscillospiraceae bacterium]
MIRVIEATGKTEDDAIQSALAELGCTREQVSVEILERAKSGFLGIGATPAKIRVSFEEPDDILTLTENFLKGLLEKMGSDAVPVLEQKDENTIYVNLTGEKLGMLIGRRGETLDAIQHIANYAMNRVSEKHVHISVDAENYRSKREESLQRLAEKVAAKVLKYRKNMTLEPMNSYERHVIHTALQDYEGVSTFSTGTEPNRRIVVAFGNNSGLGRDGGKPRYRS